MKKYSYLILGGGAAGTIAAETIRSRDPKGTIAIINNEPETLYSKVMLTNLLAGKATEAQLKMRAKDDYTAKNINLIFGVISKFDSRTRQAILESGEVVAGDKVLIALGLAPRHLDIPGADLEGVTYLSNLTCGRAAAQAITKASEVVILGGGFIGLESYEAVKARGVKATILVKSPWYFHPRLQESAGRQIEQIVAKQGVPVLCSEECTEFVGENGKVRAVRTASGKEIPCQAVVCGIGNYFDSHIFDDGIETVERGVVGDRFLKTSAANIWVAGDIAHFEDVLVGRHHTLGNWSNAIAQGKVAGANMTDGQEEARVISAYTLVAPDISLTFLGATEEDARSHSYFWQDEKGFINVLIDRESNKITGAMFLNHPELFAQFYKALSTSTPTPDDFGPNLESGGTVSL